jgi:hypothetical protein
MYTNNNQLKYLHLSSTLLIRYSFIGPAVDKYDMIYLSDALFGKLLTYIYTYSFIF